MPRDEVGYEIVSEGTRIDIKPKSDLPVILFLAVWLMFVSGWRAALVIASMFDARAWTFDLMTFFSCIFALFWGCSSVLAVFGILWQAAGRETVLFVPSQSLLVRWRRIGFWGRLQTFDLRQMELLQAVPLSPLQNLVASLGLGFGTVRVACAGKAYEIAIGLSKTDAQSLVKALSRQPWAPFARAD